jgi:HSP90 family molecular chaperone
MAKQRMRRKASDNVYLHKDFHGALSAGIEYVHQNYGEEAVREYLHQFASAFYAPLTRAVNERGVIALKEYVEQIYTVENGKANIAFSEDEMVVEVQACPAVTHMRKQGYHVARLFYETTRTVYQAICEDTPFAAELLEYEEETGHSVVRISRRGQ